MRSRNSCLLSVSGVVGLGFVGSLYKQRRRLIG